MTIRRSLVAIVLNCFAWIILAAVPAHSQSVDSQSSPGWLKNISATPDWWPSVKVVLTNGTTSSNCWSQIDSSKQKIDQLVDKGVSPVQERRELIKYISLCEASDDESIYQRSNLALLKASLYGALGEHRRAAKLFSESADKDPGNWVPLDFLAQEYERAGEKEYALQTYLLIENMLNRQPHYDNTFLSINQENIARLSGKTRNCILEKPEWWNEYTNAPEWLTNTAAALPPITCFQDGQRFIWATLSKQPDKQKTVRACTALTTFPATRAFEREMALAMLSLAYDDIEDHHRAIETDWQFVDQFSADGEECVKTLKHMAREFEKLGESKNADGIRKAIPCFEAALKQ